MDCKHHSGVPAGTTCAECGAPVCDSCAIQWSDKPRCKECTERRLQKDGGADAPGARRARLRKSPTVAGLLSLFPGAGQIYVGYYAAGFLHAAVIAALITLLAGKRLMQWEPFLGFFLSFFWIFTVIDAVRRARLYNESMTGEAIPKMPTDSPLVGGILLLLLGLLLTLEITFGISLAFLEPIWPLAILAGGIHLLVKYLRTKRELSREGAKKAATTT